MSTQMVSILDTPVTRQLGIEVPLICGAMYPCSNPELVAARRSPVRWVSSPTLRRASR